MQKPCYFVVAWIPSRWVGEHETALYKQREPLSIQLHPSGGAAAALLYLRDGVEEGEEALRALQSN